MTITSEITRINNNIQAAYTACDGKGATMPVTQNSANLADCINSITTGGSVNSVLLPINATGYVSSLTSFKINGEEQINNFPNNIYVPENTYLEVTDFDAGYYDCVINNYSTTTAWFLIHSGIIYVVSGGECRSNTTLSVYVGSGSVN